MKENKTIWKCIFVPPEMKKKAIFIDFWIKYLASVAYILVVGARNRTYPIPIPCSESISEPIPILESIPIPELTLS